MTGSQFDVLAALVLSGEATEKQQKQFDDMLNTSRENQIAFEKLKRAWHTNLVGSEGSCSKQKDHLWQRYQRERVLQKKKTNNLYTKIAAGLLLLMAAGLAVYLVIGENSHLIQDTVVVAEVVKETNRGEKLKTRLPDGTVVYLNAASRLTFIENFTDSSRIVELTGEGYFDVAEDKNRPFTVRTPHMDVTALGTSFGVNAYPENSEDHVALVSGKLLIRNVNNDEIKIDSGQAIVLSRANNQFLKAEIDFLRQVAWKDGVLHFSNHKFEEIVRSLELNYGVRFSVDRNTLSLIQDTYTGTFKNESLDNVLKVLSFSMDFKYDINGKEILITKN